MSGPTIPNLSALQRENIKVTRNGNGQDISMYYDKTPLHIKTTCWTCPYGRDDQGKTAAVIPDSEFFKVEELDEYGRDVCKYFLEQSGQQVPDDPDDLPYKSLIQKLDGLDVLYLTLSDRTNVFDSNGVKVSPEQAIQWTSGQFSANLLLKLGLRIWSGEDGTSGPGSGSGKYYWSVQLVQMKIRRYCMLPEGCKIFEDEEELQRELESRKKIHIKKRVHDDEAVVDFDPDVNELLD